MMTIPIKDDYWDEKNHEYMVGDEKYDDNNEDDAIYDKGEQEKVGLN